MKRNEKDEKYFAVKAISSTFLSWYHNYSLGKTKEKFNEHSMAKFIGSCIHGLLAGEISFSDIIIVPCPELVGGQKKVWACVMNDGESIENATKKFYVEKNVEKQVAIIAQKVEEYTELCKTYENKIVIGLEKFLWRDSAKDEDVLQTIINGYNAIKKKLDEIPYELYFETEVYWEEDGLECKGKIDCHFFDDFGNIHVRDFKILIGDVRQKIKDRHYVGQQAWYGKGLETTFGKPVVSYGVLAYNKTYSQVEEIEIPKSDIEKAWEGGFYKPDIFDTDTFFASNATIAGLASIGLSLNSKSYYKGIHTLLEELSINNDIYGFRKKDGGHSHGNIAV